MDIFQLWATLHKHSPVKGEQACEQTICNNTFLRIGGKIINQKVWKYDNIKFVQDLLDNKGHIMTLEQLCNKYNTAIDPMSYNGVYTCIPAEWKQLLINDHNENNYTVFAKYNIFMHEEEKNVEEIVSKDVYWYLINGIQQRATSESKWSDELNVEISNDDWAYI